MQYLLHLFLNHLPMVLEEKRLIDGKEEMCLVLPVKINQLKKGRFGNWLMTLRLNEQEPNAEMITHKVQLGYLNWDEVHKAKAFGYYYDSQRMGNVHEHDRTPSKKVNRTNNATDIRLDGIIVLSDIPKSKIFHNGQNNKRYVSNLTLRGLSDARFIYVGSLCVDDIPREDIMTNPDNGKKFINVRFQRTEYLDQYMNTHELIIVHNDSEIQIGLFKEFQSVGSSPQNPQYPPPPSMDDRPRDLPDSIQGIRF